MAGLKPADKIAWLDARAREGHKVLMVGDGLNDAPALAAAHASLSPATAADISQRAADFVFQGSKLAPVLEAISTSKRARSMALQNFAVAFVYNIICVPLAMAGLRHAADRRGGDGDVLDPGYGECHAARLGAKAMTALAWLIPVALFLGGLGLAAFLWALAFRPIRGFGGRVLSGARRRAAGTEITPQPLPSLPPKLASFPLGKALGLDRWAIRPIYETRSGRRFR